MVVGNGMLARVFSNWANRPGVIVFASGVSDSGSNDKQSFQREIDMLSQYHDRKDTLIYFSTVSIHDPSLQQSDYVQHKLNIERYISSTFSSFRIIRLPNLVGKSSNPNTLTNYLFNCIKSNKPVKIFRHAARYLMDVDDVPEITAFILDNTSHSVVIDANYNNSMSVPEIVELMEKTIKIKALKIFEDKGASYLTNNATFLSILNKCGMRIHEHYNADLIHKYYSHGL